MTSKDPKKLLLFLSSHGGSIELARIGDLERRKQQTRI